MIFREMHNLPEATMLRNYKLMSCFRHFMLKVKALLFIETLVIKRATYEKAMMVGAFGVEEVQGLPATLHNSSELREKARSCAQSPGLAVRCAALGRCWNVRAMFASDHQAENQGSCFF